MNLPFADRNGGDQAGRPHNPGGFACCGSGLVQARIPGGFLNEGREPVDGDGVDRFDGGFDLAWPSHFFLTHEHLPFLDALLCFAVLLTRGLCTHTTNEFSQGVGCLA